MWNTNEDTQPIRPMMGDTQPIRPVGGLDRIQWLLLGVMLLSSISLLAALRLALTDDESAAIIPSPTPQTVLLRVGGEQRDVQTHAQTVAALLDEQGVQVSNADAISPAPATALTDDMQIVVDRARTVRLIVDGERRTVRTPLKHPQALLAHYDLVPRPVDRLWLDGSEVTPEMLAAWPVPVDEIVLRRAMTIYIQDVEAQKTLETTADTVGEALFEADVTLYLTDIVQPEIASPLQDNMTIQIERAKIVTIEVDGERVETRVQEGSIGDALSEAGIALNGLDYTLPPENEAVASGMTITVLRVTEDILSREESVPFETVYQAAPEVELDQTVTLQAGQAGTRRINTRVLYANGDEIGREPAGEELVRAPTNHIIGYGTKIVLRSINTPQGPQEYWRKLRVYATSYHPESVGGSTTTAIGMHLEKGIIGADPNIIPYRTRMYVPDYGVGIMADTGGPRSSPYWIDLGYSDEDFQGWHWYVDVYLLTPVPDNIRYRLPAWRRLRGT